MAEIISGDRKIFDTTHEDLNTPNRYDPMTKKLLARKSIDLIAKSNPDFSLEHEDFKNGNSLFWQQANREVRKLIFEIQNSKDPKILEAIKDWRVLIEEWKPMGNSWYNNTMNLTITLNRLEWDIKLWETLQKTRKISLGDNNIEDSSKILNQIV